MIKDPIERRSGRLPAEQLGRLELSLRARSHTLRNRTGAVGRCPTCGLSVASRDSWTRVGGVVVHSDCLFG